MLALLHLREVSPVLCVQHRHKVPLYSSTYVAFLSKHYGVNWLHTVVSATRVHYELLDTISSNTMQVRSTTGPHNVETLDLYQHVVKSKQTLGS